MRRKAVESENIASIGYKKSERKLEVRFKTGAIYQYEDVDPSMFDSFNSAESKGKFFHQNIRNFGYKYTRVK